LTESFEDRIIEDWDGRVSRAPGFFKNDSVSFFTPAATAALQNQAIRLPRWHERCFLKPTKLMKLHSVNRVAAGCLASAFCLLPSLAYAHPGHHHPVVDDGLGALRANFLHLHGNLEIGLAACALAAVIVISMARKTPLRVAAALTFCGSLGLLAFS
jgi:hypothetical protein